MLEKIYILVEEACKKDSNHFGYGIWSHHILSVIKYSKILAQKLEADEEVVEIAALLHDYSGILDYDNYLEHHIHSAKLAEEILNQYSYSKEKIKSIQHCILTHRGSKEFPRESKEAEIIASADALAHFDNFNSLLYLAFVHHGKDIDEGTNWALKKLERSWNKLIPEAQQLIETKYENIKKSFEKI